MEIKKIVQEEITSGQSIVWHRTKKENLALIQKEGYIIGGGNVVGAGIYACFDIESQLTNHHRKEYGSVIVECKVKSLDGFLILTTNEAKKVYGEKRKFADQLKTVFGKTQYSQIEKTIPSEEFNKIDSGVYNTESGGDFYREYLKKYYNYFEGLIYNSELDGKAIVCYNKENVVPLRYTEDEGDTWKPMVNQDVYQRNKTQNSYDTSDSNQIVKLLIKTPSEYKNVDLDKLSKGQIMKVVSVQSQLFDKFDNSLFTNEDIVDLIIKNNRFEKKFDLSILNNYEIVKLLIKKPGFEKKFDLTKLNNDNIVELLRYQPQFNEMFDLGDLERIQIYKLLQYQPQFAEKCDLSKLSKTHIKTLININPKFQEYFDKLQTNMINETLKRIICEELDNQEFKGIIDMIESQQLDSISLALQLAKGNKADKQFEQHFGINLKEYANRFNNIILKITDVKLQKNVLANIVDLNKIEGYQIYYILIDYPQLYKYFDLSQLSGYQISRLLKKQPQLIHKLDISKMDGDEIVYVLRHQPKLIDKINLSKLDSRNITNLLDNNPQLIKKVDISILTENDIYYLLKGQPQLKPYFDKLNKN